MSVTRVICENGCGLPVAFCGCNNIGLLTTDQQHSLADMLINGPLYIEFNLNDVFAPGSDGHDIPNMAALIALTKAWTDGGHDKVIEKIANDSL